jgi:metal-responsive CopG/Arc/MetJ family transcriptional regulator
MRHKLQNEDKRKNLSVTINPKLYDLLNKESEDNGDNKSKIVENLLRKYLNDKGINTDDII